MERYSWNSNCWLVYSRRIKFFFCNVTFFSNIMREFIFTSVAEFFFFTTTQPSHTTVEVREGICPLYNHNLEMFRNFQKPMKQRQIEESTVHWRKKQFLKVAVTTLSRKSSTLHRFLPENFVVQYHLLKFSASGRRYYFRDRSALRTTPWSKCGPENFFRTDWL